MASSRLVSVFLLAALAALVGIGVFTSISPTFLIVTGALLVGLIAGLLISNTRLIPIASRRGINKTGAIDFSPQLLSATINEMREGLLVIDREMRVLASNKAARAFLAPIEDRIESRRLTELTRNPAIYDAFLDAVRGIERAGVKVETYTQGRKVFDLRVVPLRSANGRGPQGAVGVFFDITRLERLEVVRQEFLSNVSHELRTPLTSIIALAETLEVGAIDDSQHNRRFLSIIQRNATHMHRLIDDILELSAIEAGNVRVNPEVIQLRSLVEDVIGTLTTAAELRGVVLRNDVPTEATVYADPHRLIQILTNLIDNAIKFNRENGEVVITYERAARDRIHVQDTGEGIPAHHLDRLFERFYRVDRARSRELGGTGLGLAIVKHLVRAHNGEVMVESKVGGGTKFTIELPHQVAGDAADSATHVARVGH
jgi:two-component system, OmpR family, phosphate regulon sensor histidine kinase PhoR